MKKIKYIAIFAMLIGIATTAIFVGCEKKENQVVISKQKVVKQQKYFFEGVFENIWDGKSYHYDLTRGICFDEIIIRPEQRDFYYEFIQEVITDPYAVASAFYDDRYREIIPELEVEILERLRGGYLYLHHVVNEEINREFLIATSESFYEPWVEVFTVFQFRVLNYEEEMYPFRYAIYEEHLPDLLENIRLSLEIHPEWEEKGYYTMKLDNDISQICYGFVAKSSSYFDPSIFDYSLEEIENGDEMNDEEIYADDEIEDDMCFGVKIITKNEEKFDKWVEKKIKKGYIVHMWYEDNKYIGLVEKK